ncbi:hypothetical protein C1645_734229 [Glomus cerebriforme]|uniref:BTB/POZ domain-containing protein n=1 Tax=Glomus cerebriforme TaxID=658196 RepID=A0A397TBK0_9GLOM|nr:hypothetical protein C1645_734229 [Glomus cerebriforme]
MNYEHTQNLSNDFSNLLKDPSNYDVKIRVGKEPNIEEFKAHSIILVARSVYFEKTLSPQWAKKEGAYFISNQPNISPSIFNILIKYIYSGTFSIDNNEISLVDVLIAADELELLEVSRQLEKRLLENEMVWKLPNDFITLCQHDHLTKLYEIALALVCKNPKVIFQSKEFTKLEEDCLIRLLKCDNLELEEIEIWDYLIKWGIENTESILNDDLTKWTPMDFMELEKTLHYCIPHIRFSQMPPTVFNIVRTQYKNILPKDLVEDIFQYFLDPNSKPLLKNLPLRVSAYPLDSKIINAKDAALIATWIDKKKGVPYRLKEIPFKFDLIYRASHEDFKDFHLNCDNKGPTIVIIKVRNSGEIIGGYNPLDWRSVKPTENDERTLPLDYEFYTNYKCKTSNSFIFSLFSLTNGAIPILSRVSTKKEAIIWCKDKGPCFGLKDLLIRSKSRSFKNVVGESKQKSYEEKIINKETFEIEEYEVFQVTDKRFISRSFRIFKSAVKSSFSIFKSAAKSFFNGVFKLSKFTFSLMLEIWDYPFGRLMYLLIFFVISLVILL